MHLPIRSRVNAGLALGIAALALILLFTRSSVSDLIASRRDIARAEELVMAVEHAFSLAKDAETGGRGYVITGATPFLEPLEMAAVALPTALADLRSLTADDAGLTPLVDTLSHLLIRRLEIQRRLVDIRRDWGADSAAAVVATGQGRLVMEEARRMASTLSARAAADVRVREWESELDASRAMRIVQLAAVVGVLLGVLTLVAFNRELSVRQKAERQLARALTWTSSIMEVQQDVATAGFDIRPLMKKVLARTQALTGADGAAVAVLDGDEFVRKVGTGTLQDRPGFRMPSAGSLSGLSVLLGEPLVCTDAEQDRRVNADVCRTFGIRSLVVVPLVHERVTLGVLKVAAARPDAFGDDELLTVRLMAGLLASHLGRTLAFREKEWDIERRRVAQAELETLARELARSNQELEQFAYIASHDLQEPLRMVSSYLQLLSRRYAGRLDADADEFIGYAVDGAARMQALIMDLLAYSRAGRTPVAEGTVDSDLALAEALRDLRPAIEEAGATVTHDALPPVEGDPTQLRQLFQNLVGNAVRFRGEQAPAVHVSAVERDGMVEFCVADNGIGIAPEHAHRIFQIFQRLHQRDAYGGTGIGLAICQRIVERQGGRIWVDSAPGEGARFHFTLPPVVDDAPVVNLRDIEPIMA